VLALYLLLFARGLSWQWAEVLAGRGALPALAVGEAVPAVQRGQSPAAAAGAVPPPADAAARSGAGPGAAAAAPGTAGSKTPLPPDESPPPRNATDQYGVSYDAAGVAVMGIDADSGGVYNVPPGRQVRIGGPSGRLYDVQAGGRITPADRVKVWPG
jgi:hypothetical protein